MNMREKVARALLAKDYPDDVGGEMEGFWWDRHGAHYLDLADAALDALMDPTKKMILAGEVVMDDALDSDISSGMSGDEHWQSVDYSIRPGTETAAYLAMIRAAKEGK